ncbi:thiamine ABC transporter substrate-binding protein [Prauserella sp. PE36]|uniref:Thiamine ABC transporter substrate-binding protein n=1 Tax=Prauserella endophytica TaxID=1592324 RepID=A0ABY2RUP6_9PSEU|nr:MULTISPECIES: thiamine ABC transporter substrate-binding protein [Prauserella]RBM10557.1 thiamine ABC transporter substrate-binding protein [Prauserella sp. PE36]TKG61314.1 thiamine ABC transporter substrate-binding protein [Prauserella endophytica]
MRFLRAAAALSLAGLLTAGCTLTGGNDDQEAEGPTTVTLVTHESWAAPQEVLDAFERQSGIRIRVLKEGDAGELTNKLVLTKANPIADVAYGVDSTFASRALSENVFEPYTSPEADRGPQRYSVDSQHRLSAVDVGDVCVNIDTGWFAERGLPEPATFDDLADPRYRDLLVVENPATSSPGLAFLLATVARYGEQGWTEYWQRLRDNGVQVVSGWTEAYTQEFSGSSGQGPRPIVVSYASSPAAEIGDDGKPRTKALLDTCYRQVEYAGVLAGAKHPDKAGKVVDFLLSQQFQTTVAENMYVYPAREGVALPSGWAQAAPLPEDPASLPGEQVQAGRERWIEQWRALLEG